MTELRALLRSSSLVLGMDPSRDLEQAGDMSDDAIATLASEIERLREIKRDRMQKVGKRTSSTVSPPQSWCSLVVTGRCSLVVTSRCRILAAARPRGHHARAVAPHGHAVGGADQVPERGLQHRRLRGRDHRAQHPLHGLHSPCGDKLSFFETFDIMARIHLVTSDQTLVYI